MLSAASSGWLTARVKDLPQRFGFRLSRPSQELVAKIFRCYLCAKHTDSHTCELKLDLDEPDGQDCVATVEHAAMQLLIGVERPTLISIIGFFIVVEVKGPT